MTQNWYVITYDALLNLWKGFISFIPTLLAAIIVFVIGWLIAAAIGKLVSRVLNAIKLNQLFERANWREALEAAEIRINISDFIGDIIKWILVIVFLSVAVEILGLVQFAALLGKLINWLPNLVIAVAIFVVAVIVADILDRILRASIKKIGVKYAVLLGAIIRWAIYIFALVAILQQFEIEVADWIANILTIAFAGVVIAGAIAFGLGGKDAAARLIEDLREKISKE